MLQVSLMRVILSLLLGAAVANGATSFSDLSLEFQVSADVFEGEAHELLFHQASSPVPPSRDEGKWTEIVMLGNQKFSCVSGSESPRTPNLEFREMLVDQAARVSQLAVAESFLLKESPPGPCLLNENSDDFWDFEFCPGDLVKQIPKGSAGSKNENPNSYYVLGFQNVSSPLRLVVKDSLGRHYLSQTWSGGDRCTEKVYGPRRTIEVQYHCCPNSHVALVEETSECQYVIHVHVLRLCNEPFLQYSPPPLQDLSTMHCSLSAVASENTRAVEVSAKLDGQGQSQENKESKKEVPLTLRQAILERDCVVNGKCVTEMETVAPVRDPILDSANGGIYRRETADSIDAPTFPSNEEQKESSAPSKPPSVMETLLGVLRTHIQDSEWRDILDKLDKAHEGKETKASDGVSEQSEEKAADKEDSGMRKSNLPQSLYDEPFDEDN